MRIIDVDTPGRSYDVVVGPLEHSRGRLRDLAAGRPLPLVTDERIWALHGGGVQAQVPVEPIFVPQGEAAKTWDNLHRLIARFAELNLDRGRSIIALGGGSVGDLTGLAAGLFKRGCPVVHIPTTLLAQADSAVGGKTAIDAEGQKNLVGMFHQPALVLADVVFLDTLDDRQLIGHQIVFDWLEEHGDRILGGDREMREEAIFQSISAKARIVEQDTEDRNGLRALLNLGHTFAHAIESAAGLGEVLHGEAVSIGMALAFAFSVELDLCPQDDEQRVRRHLEAAGLPTRLGEISIDRATLLPLMGADKKNEGGKLRLVLVRGIGEAFLAPDVPAERLVDFLRSAP